MHVLRPGKSLVFCTVILFFLWQIQLARPTFTNIYPGLLQCSLEPHCNDPTWFHPEVRCQPCNQALVLYTRWWLTLLIKVDRSRSSHDNSKSVVCWLHQFFVYDIISIFNHIMSHPFHFTHGYTESSSIATHSWAPNQRVTAAHSTHPRGW